MFNPNSQQNNPALVENTPIMNGSIDTVLAKLKGGSLTEEDFQNISNELLQLIQRQNDMAAVFSSLRDAINDSDEDSNTLARKFIIDNFQQFSTFIASGQGSASDNALILFLDLITVEEEYGDVKTAKNLQNKVSEIIAENEEAIFSPEMSSDSDFDSRISLFSRMLLDYTPEECEEYGISIVTTRRNIVDYVKGYLKENILKLTINDETFIHLSDILAIVPGFVSYDILLQLHVSLGIEYKEENYITKSHEDNSKFQALFTRNSVLNMLRLESFQNGSVQQLHKDFGISNFYRYPIELLKKQVLEADMDIPYGVAFYMEHDHNGALAEGEIIQRLSDDLESGGYSIRVVEIKSKLGFLKSLIRLNNKYGTENKISFLSINGHSSGTNINISEGEQASGISIHDLQQFDIDKISEFFASHPSVLFNACTSGEPGGLADVLNQGGLFKTQGPSLPTNISKIKVRWDEFGSPDFEVTYREGVSHKYE